MRQSCAGLQEGDLVLLAEGEVDGPQTILSTLRGSRQPREKGAGRRPAGCLGPVDRPRELGVRPVCCFLPGANQVWGHFLSEARGAWGLGPGAWVSSGPTSAGAGSPPLMGQTE